MFFHLSFDGKLEGVWVPKLPDGSEVERNAFSEPDIPRVSVSTSIKHCFYAIYPNVSHYFEKNNDPYMDFFIYSPKGIKTSQTVPPEELIKLRYVMDAHITREHWIVNPVKMVIVGKVRIHNPGRNAKFIKFYPFDDKKQKMLELAPERIKIETLELY